MYYTWKEERAFNEGFELAQRMFSVESKVLGVLSPGAYQAKEALRYGLSEDEYNNRKLGFALKGHFTPLTATIIKKKAEKMARRGASAEEIAKYVKNEQSVTDRNLRRLGGTLEALGGAGGLGTLGAAGVGLYDKIAKNRAKRYKYEED